MISSVYMFGATFCFFMAMNFHYPEDLVKAFFSLFFILNLIFYINLRIREIKS